MVTSFDIIQALGRCAGTGRDQYLSLGWRMVGTPNEYVRVWLGDANPKRPEEGSLAVELKTHMICLTADVVVQLGSSVPTEAREQDGTKLGRLTHYVLPEATEDDRLEETARYLVDAVRATRQS